MTAASPGRHRGPTTGYLQPPNWSTRMASPTRIRCLAFLRGAAYTAVILPGGVAAGLAIAYLPPGLAILAAVVAVSALAGVGWWLTRDPNTGGNVAGGDAGGNVDEGGNGGNEPGLVALAAAGEEVPAELPRRRVGAHSREAVRRVEQPTTRLRVIRP